MAAHKKRLDRLSKPDNPGCHILFDIGVYINFEAEGLISSETLTAIKSKWGRFERDPLECFADEELDLLLAFAGNGEENSGRMIGALFNLLRQEGIISQETIAKTHSFFCYASDYYACCTPDELHRLKQLKESLLKKNPGSLPEKTKRLRAYMQFAPDFE